MPTDVSVQSLRSVANGMATAAAIMENVLARIANTGWNILRLA
jgi:hypothetical protein